MLRRAVEAHKAALEVTTRERQAAAWAAGMNNLGSANLDLAQINRDTALFEQAVDAFRQARVVLTRESSPMNYALTMLNEARAASGNRPRKGRRAACCGSPSARWIPRSRS